MNERAYAISEASMDQLPSLSVTVSQALQLLGADEVDMPAVVACLQKDPALAGRILQIANSPFYGLPRQIASLREACICLGVHTIRNLVIAAGVVGQFGSDGTQRFDRFAFWKHCAGVGAMAKVLARRVQADPETSFTAGLLHDLGRMVLDVHFSSRFQKVLDYRDTHDCLIREAEEAVLGADHSFIGGSLAQRWRLPDAVVRSIQYHHNPDAKPDCVYASLVHLADALVRAIEFGDAGDDAVPPISETTMKRLSLTLEDIDQAFVDVQPLLGSANDLVEQALA